jgi:1-acyl-sn-glycerol-3-phosphate acyltransferase
MRGGYGFVSWLSRTYFRLMYGLVVHGRENLPLTGRVVLASNHRANFDPPILGGVVPREVHFFAKEELFRKPLLARLIRYLNAFPVRRGQFDRESLAACLNILKNDGALIFFPEGTRAPADGFLKAKLGLGWVVCLSDAPVVPVYIHGSATAHKPRLWGRPGIHVVFGQPIPARALQAAELRGKDQYQHVSDEVLERIREWSVTIPGGLVPVKGSVYDRTIIDNERLR